jgi:hypothetical protein
LREKINAYAGFIINGSLLRQFPVAEGRHVIIQLDCPEPPSGEIAAIVEHTVTELSKLGIGFQVHILSC